MLNFSQKWTSLPNDAYRLMLIDHTECIHKFTHLQKNDFGEVISAYSESVLWETTLAKGWHNFQALV